ncbi:hypothetical protein H6G00_33325 [Leptolyngbya sp. FACHB-541]|uniref:hypothetical protein n=1 Tax=Leptolyngbya sp. FACHB-541 TaxID=2692810 RepID=UPI00168923D0|nr:hypothetical protein [Leptolyngbya sp. FACHB-541]MBD2001423.1 hypothetical protein [Leptolyngbya sp. FACHB-541]
MRFKILSQEAFILHNLVELVQNQTNRGSQQYSSEIECSFTELVRNWMRKLAQSSTRDGHMNILEQALEIAQLGLQKRLRDYDIRYDFNSYLISARKTLKFSAKEITELKEKLKRSKEIGRVGERRRVVSDAQVSFELVEIGLQSAIEGLIASPIAEVCELNLDEINRTYQVQGDWFPFHITIQNLVFVIDDDGTIFVSTENLPEVLIMEAEELLERIASQVYLRIK